LWDRRPLRAIAYDTSKLSTLALALNRG